MEVYKEEKRKVKRCIIQSKKKVNEQFGRKMNEDVNGNMKLFWKEVSNAKGEKVESCSRVKDGNGRLAKGEDGARKIWKEYFDSFYGIRRGNYFEGEPIGRADFELRVGELKNGKATGKNEITGEMIKGGGDRGWWIGYGDCVLWPLRVMLFLKIGVLL